MSETKKQPLKDTKIKPQPKTKSNYVRKGGHGGARKNSGRKTKAEEFKMIELMDKQIDPEKVMIAWKGLIDQGNIKAIEMYNHYRYGKPVDKVEQININHDVELPKFSEEEIKEILKQAEEEIKEELG